MSERLQGAARIKAVQELDDWHDVPGRDAITKSFRFKNFRSAFAFMTEAALVAEKMDHHPEWSNVYGRVEVTLTTHSAQGLTQLDIALAKKMDEIAKT
ncbi:4a-hydroxytetrahydrobiopterin dehydratase [Aestuariivirga sp.]|uniref:4a-hydroxytetrahydrobiopterin dehydratase n=1 Tax=Aestuariivirga sp. TaxID=2650926 RepID=UPI0039E296B6